jgi:hypothetical protein
MYAAHMLQDRHRINLIEYALILVFVALSVTGCASDALSIEPPNIINVTPQPSIVSVGESIRVDFYPQEAIPEGTESSIRQLDTTALEELGILIEGWNFRSAFDFSITMSISEQTKTGNFQLELPLSNEYERFVARFNLQVTR